MSNKVKKMRQAEFGFEVESASQPDRFADASWIDLAATGPLREELKRCNIPYRNHNTHKISVLATYRPKLLHLATYARADRKKRAHIGYLRKVLGVV